MDGSKVGGFALALVGLFLVPVVIVFIVFLGAGGTASTAGACGPTGLPGSVQDDKSVAGFSGSQLSNAAEIMTAAWDLGLPVAAQILGVQAAIGESTLNVIDYGDAVGPDSRGLFQQRANGAWGSYEDRMDPRTSATNFFKALQRVEGWEDLEPSIAIHRTQRNADPNHYTAFRSQAAAIVKALSTGKLEGVDANGTCMSDDSRIVGALGSGMWVHPIHGGRETSGFGARPCPVGTDCNVNTANHKGIDFAKGGQSNVVAPADMKITVAERGQGWKAAYGTYVIAKQVDKPGLVFEFHHLAHGSLKVKTGDIVAAGTPLGVEGGTGNASGVHLHFQIASPDAPANQPTFNFAIDPAPILKSKGVL